MNLGNIIYEKKTTIVAFLIAASTLAKTMGWLSDNVAGGLTAFIPEMVNFAVVIYLALAKDGK